MKSERTKKTVMLAVLAALAYVLTVAVHIPVQFLSYEPKDILITVGGFIFGPLAAAAVSVVVSLAEMLTISSTGIIGFIMNVIASCAFACTAAFVYKKIHSAKGALIGLLSGVVCMTAVMLLWNYLLTPLYLNSSREDVAAIMIPLLLPFNLLKGGINAAVTMLVYKPIVTALRKSGLLPASKEENKSMKINIGFVITGAVVLISCVLLILVLAGVL